MEMIKTVLTTSTLFVFFLFGFIELNAQPTTPPQTLIADDQQDGHQPPEVYSCDPSFFRQVFVTNLVHVHHTIYNLPNGATPIFVKVSVNNESVTVPLGNSFELYGTYNGENIYVGEVWIPFDFSSLCEDAQRDGNEESEPIEFQRTFELVDAQGNPYPYNLNDGPDDVFSCLVFCDGLCPVEDNGEETCLENVVDRDTIKVACNSCPDNSGPSSGKIELLGDLEKHEALGTAVTELENKDWQIQDENKVKLSKQLLVSPNPFQDELKISFEAVQGQEAFIQIFDIKGTLIYTQEIQAIHRGIQQLEIETSTWKTGIFFGQIKTSIGVQTFKVSKNL